MKCTVTALIVAFTVAYVNCQGIHTVTEKEVQDKAYVYVTKCRNVPNGFCINHDYYRCPDGHSVSLNGCGFREWCCYPTPTQAPTQKPTTSQPVTVAGQTPTPTSGSGLSNKGQCGRPSVNEDERIVGGSTTSIEANPWQVSLRFYGSHICGGSLISEKWVMTAAHCIKEVPNLTSTSQLSILTGSTKSDSFYRSDLHAVDKVIVHGGYNSNTKVYDIALIKLKDTVDLSSDKVSTVCLPTEGQRFESQVCRVTGWGTVTEGVEGSVSNLRKVSLPVLSSRMCNFYWGGQVHASQFCAGDVAGGRDSCQGDSGGPLVCKQADGSFVQAGIVSGGNGCGRKYSPGFYTDVPKFIDFIDQVLTKY